MQLTNKYQLLGRIVRPLAVCVLCAVAIWTAMRFVPAAMRSWRTEVQRRSVQVEQHEELVAPVELIPGDANACRVSADAWKRLGLETATVVEATPARLRLQGSLYLDPNDLVRVRSRFPGEVVEVAQLDDAQAAPMSTLPEGHRQIRFGDFVERGQLLAVIWSRELGEKKSELMDALSRLRFDRITLERLTSAGTAVPEKSVREAERQVEFDLIDVAKIESTLAAWRLTSEEIAQIRTEAEQVGEAVMADTGSYDPDWARVEIRAPLSGVIIEKNITPGSLAEIDLDLFKIADLSHLDVVAHAYEEDLPALQKVAGEARDWEIRIKSDPDAPPVPGRFDRIGTILDPSQHTALVMGWVDNSSGALRVGQFVNATIELAAEPAEIDVPWGAVFEQDGRSYLFVASTDDPAVFYRRPVEVERRNGQWLTVRSPASAAPDSGPQRPAEAGQEVVSVGGVLLASELDQLQAEQ